MSRGPHPNGRPPEPVSFLRRLDGKHATLAAADDDANDDDELAELNEEMRKLRERMRRVIGGAIPIETKEK